MPNEIQLKNLTQASFTITLGSLASATSRQSTMIDNSTTQYPGALVYAQIKSGTAPTSGTVYEVFLIRGDASATHRTDNAGASDAAITIENAPLLGVIVVTNSANKIFYGEFDTSFLGALGAEWGIAVRNSSGQTLNASGHQVVYTPYIPEIQ
jgi:hypothetical protein